MKFSLGVIIIVVAFGSHSLKYLKWKLTINHCENSTQWTFIWRMPLLCRKVYNSWWIIDNQWSNIECDSMQFDSLRFDLFRLDIMLHIFLRMQWAQWLWWREWKRWKMDRKLKCSTDIGISLCFRRKKDFCISLLGHGAHTDIVNRFNVETTLIIVSWRVKG